MLRSWKISLRNTYILKGLCINLFGCPIFFKSLSVNSTISLGPNLSKLKSSNLEASE